MIGKAYGRRVLDHARRERQETALVCTYIANTVSKNTVTFKSVYGRMEIKDPEEKPDVPVYSGTLLEQLEQHTEHLKTEGKL